MLMESGAAPDLSSILTPTLEGALADPATQQAFNLAVARALDSERVKESVRPYFMEGALWVGAAVALAILAGRRA